MCRGQKYFGAGLNCRLLGAQQLVQMRTDEQVQFAEEKLDLISSKHSSRSAKSCFSFLSSSVSFHNSTKRVHGNHAQCSWWIMYISGIFQEYCADPFPQVLREATLYFGKIRNHKTPVDLPYFGCLFWNPHNVFRNYGTCATHVRVLRKPKGQE